MDFFVFISEQWLLVSVGLVLIYLLAITEGAKGGKPLSSHEVTRLLNADEALLLDIRTSKEFEAGHITGAINIPFANMATRKTELESSKGKVLIVADKVGQHAGAIGKQLRKDGYDVRRIRGGMAEWQNQNLPLVTAKAAGKAGKKSKGKGKK